MATLLARWWNPAPASSSKNNTNNNATSAPPRIPLLSTTFGAAVDSFYRSGMNAQLNRRLTNKPAPLFPNMHIQTPVRILYMNGIKNFRAYLDREKPSLLRQGYDPALVRYGTLFAPGLLMTPFSSVLEASNAGHMNPEPMATRWIRGLAPRTLREVIFAIGLNQVSDFSRDKLVPRSLLENETARSVVGSITAGALAGYVSHVPHNLSTLKLLRPNIPYTAHFQTLLQNTVDVRLNKEGAIYKSDGMRRLVGTAMVFLLPKGVLIRTAQIVGSFVIVNGTISLFEVMKVEEKAEEYGKAILPAKKPTAKSI